ncbi:Membrane metallo-endopeptidase-like 1 isoform X2 [Camponotus japonicus]
MARFLLLYFGIIITTIFGINCNIMYLPCAPCVLNYYHKVHDKIKPFCEGCIPNYNNFDHSSKLMLINYKGKNNNPCIDFYEFSCGIWDNANSIFQTKWSTKDYIQYKTYYYIKRFLETENKYDHLPFVKLAKQFYGSCINKDTLEERGLEPMQQMLDATGGWPILMSEEEKNAKEITWQKMDNDYLQLYTFSILFNISYTINDGNSILMVHPSLSLPLGDKLKIDLQDENYDVYISTVMKVVKAFAKDKGIQIPESQLYTDIIDLVLFETSLLNIGYEKKIPTAGNKMTIAELQKFYDLTGTQSTAKINWLDKIQIVSKFLGITVNASETVLVYDKEILHKLTYLLDATSQHTIVNYLQWHIVRTFMGNLNEQMRDIELEHYNTSNTEIYNRTKQERRWLKCIKEFQMKDALLYLYTKTIISEDTLEAVSDILGDLKDRMFHYLYSNNTLQLNILMRRFIRRKIYNISLQVGYFERYDDQTALTEMYNGLKINDNYFTNVLTIIKYRNIRKQRSFHESKHKDESLRRWSFDFISDNPSYDQRTNVICEFTINVN